MYYCYCLCKLEKDAVIPEVSLTLANAIKIKLAIHNVFCYSDFRITATFSYNLNCLL